MANSQATAPALATPSPRSRRRGWLWVVVGVLCLTILASIWRLLFFELSDSDEFKPPSWDGRPRLVETAFTKINPPPNAGFRERLSYAVGNFRRKYSGKNLGTYTFAAQTNALHSVRGLLKTCMEVNGTNYLVAEEACYIEFGHTNALNGRQWVAAVEQTLQVDQAQCAHPASNALWGERLLFIRENSGVVKVIPPSRLADYQKAGLVDPTYKPRTASPAAATTP